MILNSQVVQQVVDAEDRDYFVKDLVLARGAVPIAMVRKRLAHVPDGAALADLEPEAVAVPTRATVLLIHGFAQNRYAFHLPTRSMVNHLARAGLDVFNIDLRGRGRSGHLGAQRPSAILEFIREDVPTALEEIARLTGPRPVFLVGHSLGGFVAYAVAVDHRPRVAGIVALATPYHFALGSRWLDGFGAAFLALDRRFPVPNLAIPTRSFGSLVRATRRFIESPLYPFPIRGFRRGALEPEILNDHMRLAMDLGSISTLRGIFTWASERKTQGAARRERLLGYGHHFEALDVPLLVVSGAHDDLAPPASVKPAYALSTSSDKQYRELPFGHIDILVGRDAPLSIWPLIEAWIGQRAARAGASDERAA
jgi:alpha-beta hydrolase superfamily lysophospholipase